VPVAVGGGLDGLLKRGVAHDGVEQSGETHLGWLPVRRWATRTPRSGAVRTFRGVPSVRRSGDRPRLRWTRR
jgi:hypothetical protein